MPYILKKRREELVQESIEVTQVLETTGELNFFLTEVILSYCLYKKGSKSITYQLINDILGALEGAKLEFYRRVASPYEDKKCADNGDVYNV